MQLFLLNKPVIIKGKLHKKSGLQESQKISCMTRFLFVLIQNIHPANSEELEKAFVKGEQPETVNGPVHIKDELPIYLL